MSLNLFIIGPSGCGKSTQAKLIAEKYGLTHISTGEAFRHEMATGTPIGIESKSYMDRGLFVPSEILIRLFAQEISKINNQNFIVDGTPRIPDQCPLIENYLSKNNQTITAIIHLDISFEEINARRQKAGTNFQKDDTKRSDNTPEAILHRQQEYLKNNDPILEYFQSRNKLIRIDGNRPVELIFADIVTKIDLLNL